MVYAIWCCQFFCFVVLDKKKEVLYTKVVVVFDAILPEVEKDNQPEIKSRVTDTKNLFKND